MDRPKQNLSPEDVEVLRLLDEAAQQYDAYLQLSRVGLVGAGADGEDTWRHNPEVPLSLVVKDEAGK